MPDDTRIMPGTPEAPAIDAVGNEWVLHEGREIAFFASPAAFRDWLAANAHSAPEVFVGFWRISTGRHTITWEQSVDEALCYGWIDSIRRSLDDTRHYLRFTPRRPGSVWSAINVRRVPELHAEGRMQPAGLAVFEARKPSQEQGYTYQQRDAELTPELQAIFEADSAAWTFFQSQPPGYQRTARWWIMYAKRDATRQKRVEALRTASAAGRRLYDVSGNPKDREPNSSG